jgi:predicted site-specific integrase-resolvase
MTQSEWMTTEEAREYLQIAPATMAKILRDGHLQYTSSKLDKRYKMLRRSEVEEFARVNGIVPKNRARAA